MFWWVSKHCIKAKHHRLRSYLAFVVNQCKYNTSGGMYCVQRLYNAFTSIDTTNYISNQMRSGNWCHFHLHITNTTNKMHLINLYATCLIIKLLKLLCLSAVLLYTQFPIILHPNVPNINVTPITIHFPTHFPSIFYN